MGRTFRGKLTTAYHENKNHINSIHVLWYTTCSDQNAIIKNCYGEYITKLLLFSKTLNYISVKTFYILFNGFLSNHTVMPRDWFRCTLLSWLQRFESWTDWQNIDEPIARATTIMWFYIWRRFISNIWIFL